MTKQTKIIIIVIVIAVLLGVAGFVLYKNNTVPNNLPGGDRDEHGCIGSAGYSWCEAKNKCLRQWEEECSK